MFESHYIAHGRTSKGAQKRHLKALKRCGMTLLTVSATGIAGAQIAQAQCVTQGPAFGGFQLPTSSLSSIVTTLNTVNTGSLAQSGALLGSPSNPKPDQLGAGIWVREIGGEVETKDTSSTQRFVNGANTGSINCDLQVKQRFTGTQLGFDIARHNLGGGANLHLGVTAGMFDVKSTDKTPGSTFKSEADVPFAGVYAAFYNQNLTLDGQVRWDFYKNRLSDQTAPLFNQQLDARSISLMLNAAYRLDLANKWFIEPSVGGVWSKATVDPLNVSGAFVALADFSGASPGTFKIEDIHSVLGRASVRIGTSFQSGNVNLVPFVTASVFREFAGAVKSSTSASDSIAGFGADVFTTNTSSARVGTYGHLGLGLAGSIIDTGWLGYIRADYRKGENLEGLSFNAGLRYQFTPPKDQDASIKDGRPSARSADYNWTGVYAGVMAGVVVGTNDLIYTNDQNETSPQFAGALLGGQIGYNYQIGRMVLGVEADGGISNALGGKACSSHTLALSQRHFQTCSTELNNLITATGRIGYALDRMLIYGKGGWARADIEAGSSSTAGPNLLGVALLTSASTKVAANGWTIGGGLEYALTDKWSAKGEYMYYNLGTHSFRMDTSSTGRASGQIDGSSVRLGLSYHLGK